MEVSASPAPEAKPTGIADRYLSAPPILKRKARNAIGTRNDDDTVERINSDSTAAATVSSIIERGTEQTSLLTEPPPTANEDVLYPRRRA